MTVVHLEQGYLDGTYSTNEYLTWHVLGSMGIQFQATIDKRVALGAQLQATIANTKSIALQLESFIQGYNSIGTEFNSDIIDKKNALGIQFEGKLPAVTSVASQFQAEIKKDTSSAIQFNVDIINRINALALQLTGVVTKESASAIQFLASLNVEDGFGIEILSKIVNSLTSLGVEYESVISTNQSLAAEYTSVINSINAHGTQYLATIVDRLLSIAIQLEGFIIDRPHSTGSEFEGVINYFLSLAIQIEAVINAFKPVDIQFQSEIMNRLSALALEYKGIIDSAKSLGAQFQGQIPTLLSSGIQFNALLGNPAPVAIEYESRIGNRLSVQGAQFISAPYMHIWSGYLVEEYLMAPYFVKRFTVHAGLQFNAQVIEERGLGFQFTGVIQGYKSTAVQYNASIINYIRGTAVQFISINPVGLGAQFRSALYNIDNLRILCEFPSRGTGGGTNWVSSSTAAGDFNIANVNTDIVEQVWRSQTGTITNVKLECDTGLPQGVFLDTLALLNHNLTTSATVLLEGDDDPLFGSPGFTQTLEITIDNTYYIAPDLPLSGYRYWRFTISDPTNADNYLQIGTILFGEAIIMVGESFSNPVRLKKKHFSDKVYTEGFTNVSNDRTFKKSISLSFQNITISGGNYANLSGLFETARTNLKCLWIPTPKYPIRYATFGKLSDLPDEEHNDLGASADYVNFSVEVDESL